MKKIYVHPVMRTVILAPRPLMLGGSKGGNTNASDITTPGVVSGNSRCFDSFDDSDEGF